MKNDTHFFTKSGSSVKASKEVGEYELNFVNLPKYLKGITSHKKTDMDNKPQMEEICKRGNSCIFKQCMSVRLLTSPSQ